MNRIVTRWNSSSIDCSKTISYFYLIYENQSQRMKVIARAKIRQKCRKFFKIVGFRENYFREYKFILRFAFIFARTVFLRRSFQHRTSQILTTRQDFNFDFFRRRISNEKMLFFLIWITSYLLVYTMKIEILCIT